MPENDSSPKTPTSSAQFFSSGNTLLTSIPTVTSTLIPLTGNPATILTPISSSAVTTSTPISSLQDTALTPIAFETPNETTTPIQSSTSCEISSAVKTTPRLRGKRELPNINFELEGEKIQKREKPSAISLKPEKSKTAALLQKLLEDSQLANEYEQLKDKCKLNPKFYGDEFKQLMSRISVKLQCVYNRWWSDIVKMEKEILIKDNIVNDEDREIYNKTKRNVVLCEKLKVIFALNDPY